MALWLTFLYCSSSLMLVQESSNLSPNIRAAVDDRCCGARFAPFLLAYRHVERMVNALQRAIPIPQHEILLYPPSRNLIGLEGEGLKEITEELPSIRPSSRSRCTKAAVPLACVAAVPERSNGRQLSPKSQKIEPGSPYYS